MKPRSRQPEIWLWSRRGSREHNGPDSGLLVREEALRQDDMHVVQGRAQSHRI
jgi:hypothetical protein